MKRKLTSSPVVLLAALLTAGLLGFLIGTSGKWRLQAGPNLRLTASAQAQSQLNRPARGRECTSALLQGAYAFSAEGTITAVPQGSPFPPGHYATVGVINFDGQGNLSLSNTQSYSGLIIQPTNITGIYVIGNDCSGRVTLNTGAVFNVVAADGGREVHFIQINNSTVIRGTSKKI
ncbi:MAG: hypothetical protein AB7U82_07000 [Blastocatellales bacterium]